MNAVSAIKWTMGLIERNGTDLTLNDLEQHIATDPLSEADRDECQEWVGCMRAELGADARAVDAVIHKLTTVGTSISQRLNRPALEKRSVDELQRLLDAFWHFKHVIEEVLPK